MDVPRYGEVAVLTVLFIDEVRSFVWKSYMRLNDYCNRYRYSRRCVVPKTLVIYPSDVIARERGRRSSHSLGGIVRQCRFPPGVSPVGVIFWPCRFVLASEARSRGKVGGDSKDDVEVKCDVDNVSL